MVPYDAGPDGSHIPIAKPRQNSQYFSYKGKYSINVQLVCEVNGKFLDVNATWPG